MCYSSRAARCLTHYADARYRYISRGELDDLLDKPATDIARRPADKKRRSLAADRRAGAPGKCYRYQYRIRSSCLGLGQAFYKVFL
jgi:hypothetical protein